MTRINPNYIFTCLIRFHTETPINMPLCNIILVCDFHRKNYMKGGDKLCKCTLDSVYHIIAFFGSSDLCLPMVSCTKNICISEYSLTKITLVL